MAATPSRQSETPSVAERTRGWKAARDVGLVVLPPDRELWINKRWWNVMGQGYGWRVEAVSGDGFNDVALGGTLSYSAARWKMFRWERRFRRQYREWSP